MLDTAEILPLPPVDEPELAAPLGDDEVVAPDVAEPEAEPLPELEDEPMIEEKPAAVEEEEL
jgi:hypothetical protein